MSPNSFEASAPTISKATSVSTIPATAPMVFAEVRTSPALSFSRRALDTLFGLRVSSRTKAAISGVRLLTSSLVVVVMVVVVVVVLSVVVVKVTLGPVDAEGCGELRVEVRDRVTVAVAVWVWVRAVSYTHLTLPTTILV